MNKKFLTQILSFVALALIGWGCEVDHYNEHMIDGYEPDNTITDVQTVNRTLSEGDYSAISSNSANKALAEAAGEDAVAALAAIGKNKYFASADQAATYIPGLLADEKNGYPTLDNGSVVMVTYTHALEMPAELEMMNAATSYTLSEDDYKAIWGSETDYVKAVTPATVNKIKNVLSSEDLREGEYVAVSVGESTDAQRVLMKLNETGKIIAENYLNGIPKEEIVLKLMDEYEVDEQTATRSVERIVRQMLDAGIAEA